MILNPPIPAQLGTEPIEPLRPFTLVLASGSPRRRELLAQAGYIFTVQPAEIDESPQPNESPDAYVRRLAEEKARAVLAEYLNARTLAASQVDEFALLAIPTPNFTEPASALTQLGMPDLSGTAPSALPVVVLGADTTVVCDGAILGKPASQFEAREMLRRLSGRSHQVLTGIAVATAANILSAVESTEVVFAGIPPAEREHYCATPEPLDKAGAYGIQGYAARWIPRISGDYFNVMGLPIARTVRLLEAAMASA